MFKLGHIKRFKKLPGPKSIHHHEVMRLAKLLSSTHAITSIVRDPSQEKDIKDVSATLLVLSLEDSPAAADFSQLISAMLEGPSSSRDMVSYTFLQGQVGRAARRGLRT